MKLILIREALLTSGLALLFIIQVEAFGFALMALIKIISAKLKWKAEANDWLLSSVPLRVFLGLLAYSSTFFLLGLGNLLSKTIVLVLSAAITLLVWLAGRRWRAFKLNNLHKLWNENKFIFLGLGLFFLATGLLWFRPIAWFDALWYHMPIPKFFLQQGNINQLGPLMTFSLHPSMDYMWYLWPLSLPIKTTLAGIVINFMQAFTLMLALWFVVRTSVKLWNWGRIPQILAPLMLGMNYEAVAAFGTGYSDIFGLTVGMVTALYVFYLLSQKTISWPRFLVAILLLVAFATLKIFFTVVAVVLFAYLLFNSWKKLPKNQRLITVVLIIAGSGAVFYLPWLARSYHATGRLFDPVGNPAVNADVYLNSGGGTAINHWTEYITKRFYDSALPFLSFIYSPLILFGVLSIFSTSLRRKIEDFWLVGVVGSILVFTLSIALQWRYNLPATFILLYLGLVLLIEISRKLSLFGQLMAWSLPIIFVISVVPRVIYSPSQANGIPNNFGKIYAFSHQSRDVWLDQHLSQTYDYRPQMLPQDLSESETIFVGGLHNLAYIDNPMLEADSLPEVFKRVTSPEDLAQLLKNNGVRYMLVKGTLSEACSKMPIKTISDCETSTAWQLISTDQFYGARWFKLN